MVQNILLPELKLLRSHLSSLNFGRGSIRTLPRKVRHLSWKLDYSIVYGDVADRRQSPISN
jgi:hypothetical protein